MAHGAHGLVPASSGELVSYTTVSAHFYSIQFLNHVKFTPAVETQGCLFPHLPHFAPGSFWSCFFLPVMSQIKIDCLRQAFADCASEI